MKGERTEFRRVKREREKEKHLLGEGWKEKKPKAFDERDKDETETGRL